MPETRPLRLFDSAVESRPINYQSTMANVPETVLRKRKRNEEWAAKKAAASSEVRVCLMSPQSANHGRPASPAV